MMLMGMCAPPAYINRAVAAETLQFKVDNFGQRKVKGGKRRSKKKAFGTSLCVWGRSVLLVMLCFLVIATGNYPIFCAYSNWVRERSYCLRFACDCVVRCCFCCTFYFISHTCYYIHIYYIYLYRCVSWNHFVCVSAFVRCQFTVRTHI